jgi:hypothetical protein
MIAGMEKNLGNCSTGKPKKLLASTRSGGRGARPYMVTGYGTFTDSL